MEMQGRKSLVVNIIAIVLTFSLLFLSSSCGTTKEVLDYDVSAVFAVEKRSTPMSEALFQWLSNDHSIQIIDIAVCNGRVGLLASNEDGYQLILGEIESRDFSITSLSFFSEGRPERIFLTNDKQCIVLSETNGDSFWEIQTSLHKFSEDLSNHKEVLLENLEGNAISDACYDPCRDFLWIATVGGLFSYSSSGELRCENKSKDNETFTAVTTVGDGSIYILAFGSSLRLMNFKDDGKTIIQSRELSNFPESNYMSIRITASVEENKTCILINSPYALYEWKTTEHNVHKILDKRFEGFSGIGSILSYDGAYLALSLWSSGSDSTEIGLFAFSSRPVETEILNIAILGISEQTLVEFLKYAGKIRSLYPNLSLNIQVYPETVLTESQKAADPSKQAKALLELLSQNMPDVFCVSSEYIEVLENASALTDLRVLYGNDENFNIDDYLENVWNASKNYEAHYFITPFFGMSGVMCRQDANLRGSLSSLSTYIESNLKIEHIMQHDTQWNIFDTMWPCFRTEFLSREGTFDKEKFAELLLFCMENGEKYYEDKVPVVDQISSGNLLFIPSDIGSYDSFLVNASIFAGNADYIGLLDAGEGQPLLTSDFCLAISDSSDKKEDAWQVLSFFLSDEVQMGYDDFRNNESSSIPIEKTALESMLGVQFELYMDGRSQVIPPLSDTEDIQRMDAINAYLREKESGLDDDEISRPENYYLPFPYPEDQTAKLFRDMLSKPTTFLIYDMNVDLIVYDEARKCFLGDVTPEQAAESISSRLDLYLSEKT